MRILVEIVGLPGSGKSYLLEKLERVRNDLPNLLKPSNPSLGDYRKQILRLAVRFGLRRPLSLMRLGLRSDGRWLLSKLAYRAAVLKSRPGSSGLLVDSGLLQPLISYAAEYSKSPIRVEDVLATLSALPMPYALIYLDNGVEVAQQRYRNRQERTGRRADVDVTPEAFAQAQEICTRIVDMFPSPRILHLSKNGDFAESTLDEVVAHLNFWINDIER
jgi:hypothetical protein